MSFLHFVHFTGEFFAGESWKFTRKWGNSYERTHLRPQLDPLWVLNFMFMTTKIPAVKLGLLCIH